MGTKLRKSSVHGHHTCAKVRFKILLLVVVMGLIIVFVGYIYVVRWGPLCVGINYYIGIFLIVQKTCLNVIFYCYMANKLFVERIV